MMILFRNKKIIRGRPKENNTMIYRIISIFVFKCWITSSMMLQAQQGEINALDDLALEAPTINITPLPYYDYDRLDYSMNRGIAQTIKGRIWACWVGGGDNDDAFLLFNSSDDYGLTWSKPRVAIDSHYPEMHYKRRIRVGNVWVDPYGKLWVFFDQNMTTFDGRAGLWYTVCENPDSENPQWSKPVRIWHGCALNKPVILSDGTWMLPVSLWDRQKIKHEDFKEAFPNLDTFRMANVFISKDKGKSWERIGGVQFPKPQFDEHHIIERYDGSLWMTTRTGDGIWESISLDQGQSWSEPQKYMEHIGSRHHIQRLISGSILLVKHGDIDERTTFRSKLSAYLSEDEGKTWIGGLMIDERRGISYPDGFQASDGTIYISYDRNRDWDGEILMAKFTENDILHRDFVSPQSQSKITICKPEGLDKLPPPSDMIFKKNNE